MNNTWAASEGPKPCTAIGGGVWRVAAPSHRHGSTRRGVCGAEVCGSCQRSWPSGAGPPNAD
eukprot:12510069-Alexandrium_andersonii.AAC.1